MPFDKAGKHHMNTQKAMASDKMPPAKPKKQMDQGVGDPMKGNDETDMGGDSTRTMIDHNDDGSHSVQHADGEVSGPHDSIEEALAMIAAKHGGGMEHPGMQHESGVPRHGTPMHEGHAMMSGM